MRKQLLTGTPMIYEYLDRGVTEALINEHLCGAQNRRLFIWSLLNVEHWLTGSYA